MGHSALTKAVDQAAMKAGTIRIRLNLRVFRLPLTAYALLINIAEVKPFKIRSPKNPFSNSGLKMMTANIAKKRNSYCPIGRRFNLFFTISLDSL
jgi:hypothetical protein